MYKNISYYCLPRAVKVAISSPRFRKQRLFELPISISHKGFIYTFWAFDLPCIVVSESF